MSAPHKLIEKWLEVAIRVVVASRIDILDDSEDNLPESVTEFLFLKDLTK